MATAKTKIETKVENEDNIETKPEIKLETKKEEYKPTERNEYIEVICNTYTDLVVVDKMTGLTWMFEGDFYSGIPAYDTRHEMQYMDLMKLRNSKFLNEPWMLIDRKHQNAIRDLGLKNLYEKIIYPDEMDEFFNKSVEEMKEFLHKTTAHMKLVIASVAIVKNQNDEIDSKSKIKMLEHELHIKLD